MEVESKASKVYLILYNAHEVDDWDEGKDDIVFATLDKQKAVEKFNQSASLMRTSRPFLVSGEYEEDEGNTETEFRCYWGNHSYTLKLQECELE